MKITRLLTTTIGTAMLAAALLLTPQAAHARVFLSVGFAPPAIPVYEQPLCPGDGYIWTPGYWQYTDDGYEWVDGAWVVAPYTGALWTPGYWGYGDGGYFWNAGYWGPTIGYYGGINYGFGYFGTGFYGGYWNSGHFFYNREYNHFGGGFRGDHFYSQRYGNFDGRPGGASFVRREDNDRRGGTFNSIVNRAAIGESNRNGFGQNGSRIGQVNQSGRFAEGAEQRGFYNGNRGTDSFVRRENVPQRAYPNNQPGFGNEASPRSIVRPTTPANSFHPTQGNNFGGFGESHARPAAPVNSYHPAQQGGGFGGGQQRSAPGQSFQGTGQQHSSPSSGFQGGGGFHGGSFGGGSRGGGRR